MTIITKMERRRKGEGEIEEVKEGGRRGEGEKDKERGRERLRERAK